MVWIDLNCDLGEAVPGTPRWERSRVRGGGADPHDVALLDVVTSANVACGGHAGNPVSMADTARAAADRAVAVGAHPSYVDLDGFGRRPVDVGRRELAEQLRAQLRRLEDAAAGAGVPVRYVKPHGALYNRMGHDVDHAGAVVDALCAHAREKARDPLPLLAAPGAVVLAVAERAGVPTVLEAFADRGYCGDGTLIPRGQPGAVIEDAGEVARRAVALALREPIETDAGPLVVSAQSLCLHSDTSDALALARGIRSALADAGVEVRSFFGAGKGWA